MTEKPIHLEPDADKLTGYLVQQGWLQADDRIKLIERPGEGNMNLVHRIVPQRGDSFVIKQARPWVEKYPDLEAPVERIHVEQQYYRFVNRQVGLSGYSPQLLGFDPVNHVLAMEDLGNTMDFTFVYKQGQTFEQGNLWSAINYLNHLQQLRPPPNFPENLNLRKLNHQHVFVLPFNQNSFNLNQVQPGLQALAKRCVQDTALTREVLQLGNCYLLQGDYLLHGDFYPGSLLKSGDNLKVIDPEFSFVGPIEWDIAVFTAHLWLSQTPEHLIQEAFNQYHILANFDHMRFAGFTGVEVLRRLIGLAQLPVELTLEQKARLIDQSIKWIKTGKIDTLSSF